MSFAESIKQIPPRDWIGVFVFPGIWVVGCLVFAVRCAIWGMPRTPRMERLAKTKVLPRYILEYGYWMLTLPVRATVALGISADVVTYSSLVVSAISAVLCGLGEVVWGGWFLFAAFALDAMDGMVARLAGTSSDRGEYLDSLIDRYADFLCALGFMWLYRNDPLPLVLAALGMIGSSVMGYARAKGEACGVDPNVGWAQRHERGVILGFATVMSPLVDALVEPGVAHPRHWLVIFGLAIVALLTNVTAIWRGQFVVSRLARKKAEPKPAERGAVDEKRVAA